MDTKMYVKVNNIKNCKLSNDLSIPFGLYYNKNVDKSKSEIPIICNKGGLVCEKMFNKFLDEVCIDTDNGNNKRNIKRTRRKNKNTKRDTRKKRKLSKSKNKIKTHIPHF
jgi:hypothetical protein